MAPTESQFLIDTKRQKLQDSYSMIVKHSFESSAHGLIDQVLLTIPSWVLRYQHQNEISGTAAVYRDIFRSLGPSVRFLVVAHREAEQPLMEWLDSHGTSGRTEVILVPNAAKLSVWAEDAFTVCTDESGQRWVLQPDTRGRPDEGLVSRLVADRFGWKHSFIYHRFESGNILVGENFWLLGVDSTWPAVTAADNPEADVKPAGYHPHLDCSDVMDVSRRLHIVKSRVAVPGFDEKAQIRETTVDGEDWHEVVFRGNRPNTGQPIFHIDAFVTLAGRHEDGRYNLLVGDPTMATTALSTELPDFALQRAFDDIAEQLDQAEFNVVRNPLPLAYHDNHLTKTRYWYFATSNNALVEIDGSNKNVWLPTYGHGRWSQLTKTDRLNESIWQNLGFNTFLLGDHHPFAMNLGATHCLAKCLVRRSIRTEL